MRSKDWNQFIAGLDEGGRRTLMAAFRDRIPEDWHVDMTRAVVAQNLPDSRLSDAEYVRLYRRLGQTVGLSVTGFGSDGRCACALCEAEGTGRRGVIALAHDSGSQVWDALKIGSFEMLETPVHLTGVMALRRPDSRTEEEIRSKLVRRIAEWSQCLSCPVEAVIDRDLVMDGRVRDILEKSASRYGWRNRRDGGVRVYVPNCMVHQDVSLQVRIIDEKILSETVGRLGFGVLLGKGEEGFCRTVAAMDPGPTYPGETVRDRAVRYVHRTARRLATALRLQSTDGMDPDRETLDGWGRIRDAFLKANPMIPLTPGTDGGLSHAEVSLANAVASYSCKVRYNDPELQEVSRDEIRAEYNRAVLRLADRHDALEAEGREMSREDLERRISLGHPSNTLLLANRAVKDCDIVLTGKAVYGKVDSQDKQERHPYDVRRDLADLPDLLDRPLAVYYHRDDPASATVLVDRGLDDPDGHCTFIAPMCCDSSFGKEQMTIKTFFPKQDIDIAFNLSGIQSNGRQMVSYVCPDFMERWFRPACERVREYYEKTLPAIYEGEEKDATYIREMEKYEAFKTSLPFAERRFAYLSQFDAPDDSIRFFRLGDGERETDLIGRLDAPIALAASDSHREALTEYKRQLVEEYVSGMATTTPVSVCSSATLLQAMQADGCSTDEIVSVSEALSEGLEVNGFVHGGRMFILSDNMHSLEQVRNTLVHERQHILDTTVEKRRLDALSRTIGADSAWRILSCLTRDRDAYDGRSPGEMLSEACAYAMELAYACEEEELEGVLRSRGIDDDTFIEFIKDKNHGQYENDDLRAARHSSAFCDGFRERSRRVQEKARRGARLERTGARPADGHPEEPGSVEEALGVLSSLQKRGEGTVYPTAAQLEGEASSASLLSAAGVTSSLQLRINRRTLPVITKWFDRWFKASWGTSFHPIGDERLEEALPETVEEAEGAYAEELNAEEKMKAWKKNRDAYRTQFTDYISTLEGNALQLAAAKWFCTGSVRLPEDLDKVEKALHVAEANKIDPHCFNSPMELILRYARERNVRYVSPYGVPELSGERVFPSGLHYFDVQDDEQGQLAVRLILNGQSNTVFQDGSASPWCLLTATEGQRLPTESAKHYWRNYSGFQKGIWFKEVLDETGKTVLDTDGRPKLEAIAFHADSHQNKDLQTNWSIEDRPYHDGKVPLVREDDEGNRTEDVYSAKTGQLLNNERLLPAADGDLRALATEHFGRRADAILARGETVRVRRAFDADGRLRAVQVGSGNNSEAVACSYRYAGSRRTLWTEQTLESGMKKGPYRSFWPDGKEKLVCTYTGSSEPERMYCGDYVHYYENGAVARKGSYTRKGFPMGEHATYYPDGRPKSRFVYDDSSCLVQADSFNPDGTKASETRGGTITLFHPTIDPATGRQTVSQVCPDFRYVRLNAKYKGLVARERKEVFYPNGVRKYEILYDDYRKYFRRTYDSVPVAEGSDAESHVTAREWNIDGLNSKILVTYGAVKQVVCELPEPSFAQSCSMRVIYNDDWSVREVTTRMHDRGMKADGFHCLFRSDSTAVLSMYRKGEPVEASVRAVSRDEALSACGKDPLFRFCETVRTMEEKDVTGLYMRISRGRCDSQTPMDDLYDEIRKLMFDKGRNPDTESLPFRIEGMDGLAETQPATFEGMRMWFMGCGRERQLEIFRTLGLELPNQYGMGSFEEVFCHALTESPSVVLSAEGLADLYSIYCYDMKSIAEGRDESLLHNKDRSVNVRLQKSPGQEPEKDRSAGNDLTLGDAKALGSQVLEAMRNRIATREGGVPPVFGCTFDGALLSEDNALAFQASAAGRDWAPDFLTIEEIRSLGADVVRPDVRPLVLKGPADTEGHIRTLKLYNIADSTYPQQNPDIYRCYLKLRQSESGELREHLDAALGDPDTLKDAIMDKVKASSSSFHEFSGFLRNLADTAVAAVTGERLGLPYDVPAWPDELTAYRMARAVGKAAGEAFGDLFPKEAPDLRTIETEARKYLLQKKNAWAAEEQLAQGNGIKR